MPEVVNYYNGMENTIVDLRTPCIKSLNSMDDSKDFSPHSTYYEGYSVPGSQNKLTKLTNRDNFQVDNITGNAITDYYTDYKGTSPIIIRYHYTNWCPFCRSMKPLWGKLKEELKAGNYTFEEYDEDVTKSQNINSYPTIMKYYNGRAFKYPGGLDYNQLRLWATSVSTTANPNFTSIYAV